LHRVPGVSGRAYTLRLKPQASGLAPGRFSARWDTGTGFQLLEKQQTGEFALLSRLRLRNGRA
jgi:hypothetical protein